MTQIFIMSLGLLAAFAVMANQYAVRSAAQARRIRRLYEGRNALGGIR